MTNAAVIIPSDYIDKKKNSFIQGALGYALSNTKNSAPFIKVS
jgi:transcription termination factor NusB